MYVSKEVWNIVYFILCKYSVKNVLSRNAIIFYGIK